MNKRIPIRVVKEIAKEFKLDQVILVAYERDVKAEEHMTHVVTYGKSRIDCLQAAQGGNVVKKALGWPEEYCASVPRREVKRTKALESIKEWTQSRNGSVESAEDALDAIGEIVDGLLKEK